MIFYSNRHNIVSGGKNGNMIDRPDKMEIWLRGVALYNLILFHITVVSHIQLQGFLLSYLFYCALYGGNIFSKYMNALD